MKALFLVQDDNGIRKVLNKRNVDRYARIFCKP